LSEFKGKEPEALKVLREIVMKEEPKVFDLITGEDPLVRK
jgi:MoaA/NifB/PqqE/SkfB family radical SAM enzyme